MGMQTGAATVESSMEVFKKLKVELPYDPAVPLLGIYLKETETLIVKMHCMRPYEATRVPINRQVNKKAMVHI